MARVTVLGRWIQFDCRLPLPIRAKHKFVARWIIVALARWLVRSASDLTVKGIQFGKGNIPRYCSTFFVFVMLRCLLLVLVILQRQSERASTNEMTSSQTETL